MKGLSLWQILAPVVQKPPPDLKGDTHFSSQERLALRLAGLIAECETGQRDGIAECYQKFVPLQARMKNHQQGETEKRALVNHIVDQAVRNTLSAVLSKPEFLQLVCSTDKVAQSSHQTEYLKNRYKEQIGLPHTLVFDQYTRVLSYTLLQKPPQEVVTMVFKEVTEEIIDQIKSAMQEAFKTEKTLYIALQQVFEQTPEEEGQARKFIEFDEEFMPIGVTDEGAVRLALAVGYSLQPDPKSVIGDSNFSIFK